MTVITAGDPVTGVWCPVCLTDSRIRLELFLDGQPAGGLEICPGCGTGHDKPGAYLMRVRQPGDPALDAAPTPKPDRIWRSLGVRLRRAVPGAPDMCAAPHCARRPRRVIYELGTDDGTVTYWFCGRRCRGRWCSANQLAVP